jgi:hypothetical protein
MSKTVSIRRVAGGRFPPSPARSVAQANPVTARCSVVNSNGAGLADAHIRPMFLAQALSNWSQELKMETDLQLKDWVVLVAFVVFGFTVLIVT